MQFPPIKSFFTPAALLKQGAQLALLAALVTLISQWQMRDMHQADGSIEVRNRVVTELSGRSGPLLPTNKPTLLYFFAPWCSVCRVSMGNLQAVDADQIDVVAVALDYDSAGEVRRFVDAQGLNIKVVLGSQALKGEMRIRGYPSYYLVDEGHRVIHRAFGYSTELGLRIRAWLAAPMA